MHRESRKNQARKWADNEVKIVMVTKKMTV